MTRSERSEPLHQSLPTKVAPRDLFPSRVLEEKLLPPYCKQQGPSCNMGKLSFLQLAKTGSVAALSCIWCEIMGHSRRRFSEPHTCRTRMASPHLPKPRSPRDMKTFSLSLLSLLGTARSKCLLPLALPAAPPYERALL